MLSVDGQYQGRWCPGLADKYVFEMFCRLEETELFALMHDIQYLFDPAQNPREDSLWIFGWRVMVIPGV